MAIERKTNKDEVTTLYSTPQASSEKSFTKPGAAGVSANAEPVKPYENTTAVNPYTRTVQPESNTIKRPLTDGGVETQTPRKPSVADYYAGPTLPQQDPNAVYMDEIQRAMSEKNYKALMQSDIAAYNLKLNTQKYLDNMLAQQGLNSQGYGTSAHVGVENNAANLYAQNLENYNANERQGLLEAQERQNKNATESDNQLVTYLSYSDGSDSSIAGYMDKYGYEQKNGVWVSKETGEPAPAYIQAAVQSAKENGGQTSADYSNIDASTPTGSVALDFLKNAPRYDGVDANGYASIDGLSRAEVGAEDNTKTKELKDIVAWELDSLRDYIAKNGASADGTLFKLERSAGHGEAYLVLYVGGKFYIVSNDDRQEAGYPLSEAYNAYSGNKVTFSGRA